MASAPVGMAARAQKICAGTLQVPVHEVDALIRDLLGFDDTSGYIDGLLDYRNLRQAEEIFRPATGG